METLAELPILIIGAGPIGLAAAAKCAARDLGFELLEAGPRPGWAVRQWSHVRLFSPWQDCIDADAAALLAGQGWTPPEPAAFPTGGELVELYLEPLAAHPKLRDRIRFGARVTDVSRHGLDKHVARGRFETPFSAALEAGSPVLGRAVIDASGNWWTPRRLPHAGTGARSAAICYGPPDFRSAKVRSAFEGKRVLVLGAGHSGMTAIVDLLTQSPPLGLRALTWVRRASVSPAGAGHPGRSARKALEERAEALARNAEVKLLGGASVSALTQVGGEVTAVVEDCAGHADILKADAVIVATGYQPDLSLGRELWLSLDPRWESPAGLAELIDPEKHSCSSVPLHGAEELAHPERDLFIVGAKSYGRAPNFALTTGYGQLDSIIAHLDAGRGEPAARLQSVGGGLR